MKGDNVGFKDPVNAMPKVVASRSLKEPLTWNAKLLEGELAESVAPSKERPAVQDLRTVIRRRWSSARTAPIQAKMKVVQPKMRVVQCSRTDFHH
jgi:hypothetical protein